jgi:hypothetical protein
MDKAYGLGDRTVVLTDGRAQEFLAAKDRAGAPRVGAPVLFLLGIPGDDEVREADFPATNTKGKASAQGLRILLDEKLDDGDSPGMKGAPGTTARTSKIKGAEVDEALRRVAFGTRGTTGHPAGRGVPMAWPTAGALAPSASSSASAARPFPRHGPRCGWRRSPMSTSRPRASPRPDAPNTPATRGGAHSGTAGSSPDHGPCLTAAEHPRNRHARRATKGGWPPSCTGSQRPPH